MSESNQSSRASTATVRRPAPDDPAAGEADRLRSDPTDERDGLDAALADYRRAHRSRHTVRLHRSADDVGLAPAAGVPAQRGLSGFVRRYGWRAYALPVLVVVTMLALANTASSPRRPSGSGAGSPAPVQRQVQPSPEAAAPNMSLKSDQPGDADVNQPTVSDALPAGGAYTTTGTGAFTVVPGTSPVVGTGGRLFKYSVDVEGGITGVDPNGFAGLVQATLADSRSWVGAGNVTVQRVDSAAAADFHVSLTSSMTVRRLCGYDLPVETSCYDSASRRVVENVARWVRGDMAYVGDLAAYHTYMVNHEIGHALGHQHSHDCLPDGQAPVMMQQTLGLKSTTGQICQSNPWPYPPGAQGAPGVEGPDTPANSPVQIPN